MEFTKADVIQAKNILFAMKKGKFELDGEEALAFGQMMTWLAQLIKRIEDQSEMPPPPAADPIYSAPIPSDIKPKRNKK